MQVDPPKIQTTSQDVTPKASPSISKQQVAAAASMSGSGVPVGQVSQNLSKEELKIIIANVMFNLLSVHEDDRYIAEIFKRVPSAQSYPIYYDVIKNPIDFWMIFKKLKVRMRKFQ